MPISATTRYVSMVLLILSVAPWASFWGLLMSLHWKKNASFFYVSSPPEEVVSLTRVLNNPNATLEELWMALFQESWIANAHANSKESSSDASSSVVNAYLLTNLHAAHSMHHWTVAFPWMVSLVFAFIVPAFMSLYPLLGRRGRRRLRQGGVDDDPNDPWISRRSKYEGRLSRLLVYFKGFRKTLLEEDMDPNDVDNERVPKWKIPPPGMPSETTTTRLRSVPGVCSICLGQYEPGDEVIWSPNPKCRHVFHDECVLSWLLRHRKQCPCCRQSFLSALSE